MVSSGKWGTFSFYYALGVSSILTLPKQNRKLRTFENKWIKIKSDLKVCNYTCSLLTGQLDLSNLRFCLGSVSIYQEVGTYTSTYIV